MNRFYTFTLVISILFSVVGFKANIKESGLQARAVAENKHIVVYFSGSDWCSVCHKFKKGFLSAPMVDSLLQNHFVYYVADFPQRKKLDKETTSLNEDLAERLNPDGIFPLLVIADSALNVKQIITAKTPNDEAGRYLEGLSK